MDTLDETSEWRHEGRPYMTFITGTVLPRIWTQILFMGLYTTSIVAVHIYVEAIQLDFPVSLMSIIGGVTGLLLVFRTNTAYDRYWEGRKLWSTMTSHCRSLTLGIWVALDGQYRTGTGRDPKESETVDKIEQLSAINLLLAFVYATKNYLRGEYSYEKPEMKDLIPHLSKFRMPSSNKPLNSQNSHNKSRDKDPEEGTNFLGPIPQDDKKGLKEKSHEKDHMNAYDVVTPSNQPLEVIYHLYSCLQEMGVKGGADGNYIRALQASVMSLVTCLTEFERILRTPMPMAYSLHLFYTVYIYLLALPFQYVGSLNWWTIPVVILASFALLGILAIGGEIENPFGYDENDLPLDDFCKVIRKEMETITANPVPQMKSWIMSHKNCPISPSSWLNAQELSRDGIDNISTLLTRRAM